MVRTISREHGKSAALVAVECAHLAAHSLGPFPLSYGDLRRRYGMTANTAKTALTALLESGAVAEVGAGSRGRKLYRWQSATISKIDTVGRGLYKEDFKGCQKLIQSELQLQLQRWHLDADEARQIIATYPAAWITAKLDDCESRRRRAGNPAGYLRAALASIEVPAERRRVVQRLREAARRRRQAADAELAARIGARAVDLRARFAARAEVAALDWWRGLDRQAADDLAAEYAAAYPIAANGGLWAFRPGDSPVSTGWLVEQWAGRVQRLPGTAAVGIDVQADGRLFWFRVAAGPAGVALAAAGAEESTDAIPLAGARVLIDEGDGNTCDFARAWAASLRAAGIDAGTWKGGNLADGLQLRPLQEVDHAYHGNEKAHAQRLLDLLADERTTAGGNLLAEGAGWIWYGLAGRLSADERGADDHHFDACKMALAALGELVQ